MQTATYGLRKHLATLASADKPEAIAERRIHQDACRRASDDRKREYPIVTAENFETVDRYQKARVAFWTELAGSHGREYRCFKNILWGARYHPDTEAHHCRADDAQSAALVLKPSIGDGFQTMQVRVGDCWQWVTETPVHLGGIAKHWHGERV